MSQPDTSVRDSWSELKVLSRASQVRTAQGPFFPLIPGLWRPATFWKPLIAGRGKSGRSIPTQASTTASPRRMVPPLTTEA
jgi:hypothetical protein